MEKINLNELRNRAYENAIAHGWHEEEYSDKHFLCLIISELMEAVQADREDKRANVAMFKEWQGNSLPLSQKTQTRRFKEDYEEYIKGSVEEELADACIRLLDLAGLRKIDVSDFTEDGIKNMSSICNNRTFTENIYYILTLPIKFEYKYDYSFKEKVNGMLFVIFGFAEHLNIDLLWQIEQKMKYNELRPYKHGKRY